MQKTKLIGKKLLPVLFVIAIALVASANLKNSVDAKSAESIEDTVRRATAAYYAEEGVYPPGLSAIVDKYALQIDASRYEIKYDAMAENLAPDITVNKKKKKQREGDTH